MPIRSSVTISIRYRRKARVATKTSGISAGDAPANDTLAECKLIEALGAQADVARRRQARQPRGIERPVVVGVCP